MMAVFGVGAGERSGEGGLPPSSEGEEVTGEGSSRGCGFGEGEGSEGEGSGEGIEEFTSDGVASA